MRLIWVCLLIIGCQLHGFDKLNDKYLVTYGNPTSTVKIVEYFSFSCPKCVDFIAKEFVSLKRKIIRDGNIHWVFHPDPSDRLTLQAIICLESMPILEKQIFLETVCKLIDKEGVEKGSEIMKITNETLGYPIPKLNQNDFIKASPAFQDAYSYLSQKDIISSVPTIEINKKVFNDYPSTTFILSQIEALIK